MKKEKPAERTKDGGMSREACIEYINRMLSRMSEENVRLVYHFALYVE